MASQKISYDAVEKVINTILDADVTPTLEQVQRALSSDKKNQYVITHFKRWKEKNKKLLRKNNPIKVPRKNIAEIERSLALVRGVLESTNDGILVVSNEGKILEYNEKFIAVWGVPRHLLENRDDQKALASYPLTVLANPEEFYNNTISIYKDPEAQGRVPDAHFKNGKILERFTFPLKIDGETIGRVWSNRDVTQSRKIDEILRLNKRAIEASPQGIIIIDLNTANKNKMISVNPAFTEMSGYTLTEAQGKEFSLFVSPEHLEHITDVINHRRQVKIEIPCYHKNKQPFYAELHLAPVIDDTDTFHYSKKLVEETNTHSDWHTAKTNKGHKQASHYVGILIDVTEKRKQEETLRLNNRAIVASTHGIILIENSPEFLITYLNPASLRLLHLSESDILQKPFLHCLEEFSNEREKFLTIFNSEKRGVLTQHCMVNNKMVWLEITIDPVYEKDQEKISHFVSIINDITKNKELEGILKYKAVHDTLTGLPNKAYLEDAIHYCIKRVGISHENFALLFIDIDRFKNINDTLGHGVGDELLRLFGKRLQENVEKKDIVSRIGGDEFIILVNNVRSIDDLTVISKKILEVCQKKYVHSDHEFNVSASIGVVKFPECGTNAETLIRNADIAMYQAKFAGRNRICHFTNSLNKTMTRRVEIENELHNAVKNNEFALFYQPIYSIPDNQFKKAEALIRWNNKKMGFVSPAEFIPIAEDIGLMTTIGRWVMETAIAQQQVWQKLNGGDFIVSINVSAKQLLDEGFVQHFNQTILHYHVDTRKIIIEITEGLFLLEEKVFDKLNQLSNLGVKIAIDDFGTGYSNLNYLSKLHISYLKIDKSFIDQIDQPEFNDSVLLAIIAIAKRMQLRLIAEGVETKNQYELLVKNQCDEIQGYYFSKPLPAGELEKFMEARK